MQPDQVADLFAVERGLAVENHGSFSKVIATLVFGPRQCACQGLTSFYRNVVVVEQELGDPQHVRTVASGCPTSSYFLLESEGV